MLGKPIMVRKRYRLNIRPHLEYRCPLCGRIIGREWLENAPGDDGCIVTVVAPAPAWSRCHYQFGCGKAYPTPEGLWAIRIPNDTVVGVPYTWLERIANEDYAGEDADV